MEYTLQILAVGWRYLLLRVELEYKNGPVKNSGQSTVPNYKDDRQTFQSQDIGWDEWIYIQEIYHEMRQQFSYSEDELVVK